MIDTASDYAVTTINNVGFEPRGIAITNGGSDDAQETVFVTQFLSLPIAGKLDGADDAKAGHVTVISAATNTVVADVVVNPIANTGFMAAGDALQRIAPPATPAAGGLQLRHRRISQPAQQYWNPREVCVRAEYRRVSEWAVPIQRQHTEPAQRDRHDDRRDAGRTINMHSAVDAQTATSKRFITQPWAIALEHRADEGYVVSAASNIVVKLKFDRTPGRRRCKTTPSTRLACSKSLPARTLAASS